MCNIMGFPPHEVHHLRNAAGRGLGPIDPEAIELAGETPERIRFKLPVTVQRFSFIGRFVNERVFGSISRSKLVLDKKLCKKCKICVDGCPTGAMQMDDYPWINEDICIRCMCCHELCPESAWDVRGLMGRYRGRSM